MAEHYNPLAEGHVERVGHTKVNDRPIYAVVEPVNTHAVEYLESRGYVLDKYTRTDGRKVTGWVYNPPPPLEETKPEPEAEPKDTPEPQAQPEPEAEDDAPPTVPQDKCPKCGATGDDLKIFDSDSTDYGVLCKCSHMWITARHT